MLHFLLFIGLTAAVDLEKSYPAAWDVVPEQMGTENLMDLGVTTMDHLQETRLCLAGRVCSYKARIFNKMSLRSDNGYSSGMGRSVGMPTSVNFDITSHCSTPSHEYYRMDVTKYRVSALRGTTRYMREFPLFFDVDRSTGKIDRIYFSARERKSTRAAKHALLPQLAKLIHPEAMKRARKAARGQGAIYVVTGEDAESGPYHVHHTVRSLGNGDIELAENVKYQRPSLLVGLHKHKPVRTKLAIHRSRGSSARITRSGRMADLSETERVAFGHEDGAASRTTQPLIVGPGLGRSKATVRTRARLVASRPADGEECEARHLDSDESLSAAITSSLQEVETRAFRAPMTMEDWGNDDDESQAEIVRHVSRARKIMAKPNFSLSQLYETVRPSTVVPIARYARQRFAHGLMTVDDLSTVIGVLAGVRSPAGYRELLKFLQDKTLPVQAREDAAIALVHSEAEKPAPWNVINQVASVAHDTTDAVSGSARLVLGNLLRGHAGEPETNEHVAAIRMRLQRHRDHLLLSPEQAAARFAAKQQKLKQQPSSPAVSMLQEQQQGEEEDLALASTNPSPSVSSSQDEDEDEDEDLVVNLDIANDAMNLLHTLGNAGPAAHELAASEIADFFNLSKDRSVRHAALSALQELQTSEEEEEQEQTTEDPEEGGGEGGGGGGGGDEEGGGGEKPQFGGPPGGGKSGAEEELGPVKKKPLVKLNKIIYGNKNVEIRSVSNLGIKYGGHAIGSFGMGSLHARVLDFKKDLATFEYNAGTRRKKDLSGAEGVMEFTFKIVGAVVTKKNKPYAMGNVEHGGACSSTWWDTLSRKPADKKSWTRPLIIAPVRCGPALVTISIMGTVGYIMAWSGYHNCQSSETMENPKAEVSDGGASSSSTIMGGAIKGKIDVVVKSAIEYGTGKPVGWTGKFMLYYGTMPSYCILDQNMGKCRVDIKLQKMQGKITLLGKCFGPSMKRVMIEWQVPPMFKTLKSRYYGPLVDGNTQGHPTTDLQEALQIGMTYYDPSAASQAENPMVF